MDVHKLDLYKWHPEIYWSDKYT